MTILTKIDTPLGVMIAATDKVALTGLWFEGQKYECAFVKNPEWDDSLALWDSVKTWINQYYHEKTPGTPLFSIAYEGGTPFQQSVWNTLLEIPFGEVWTYNEVTHRVSKKIGRKTSPRAVANAIGKNPIALLVPCHRVVATTGKLTGFAGGLNRKTTLLQLEGHQIQGDTVIHHEA